MLEEECLALVSHEEIKQGVRYKFWRTFGVCGENFFRVFCGDDVSWVFGSVAFARKFKIVKNSSVSAQTADKEVPRPKPPRR